MVIVFYLHLASMITATSSDKNRVVEILTASFDTNKSVNYIVKQGNERMARIRKLMEYSFDVCLLSGVVYLSEDRNACVLTLLPDKKKTGLQTIWWDIRLICQVTGLSGIRKTLRREARIKKMYPAIKMNYLWFIGVTPAEQHRGAGSRLLKEVINSSGRPVYLETSMPENVNWYQRHGFEVYATLAFEYGELFMLRTF